MPRSPSARTRPTITGHRPESGQGSRHADAPGGAASVNQGRPPKRQGEPTSLGWTPARPWPIQTASRRAAAFAGLTGRPSTWSTSTPRHTEWLDTRRVPLTNQEWPVRRHDTRIRYWPAAATSSARTRRSSRGEVQSPAGRQPAPLVKLSPLGARATGPRSGAAGGWGLGAGGGRRPPSRGRCGHAGRPARPAP